MQTCAQREAGHLLRVADFEFVTATEVITQRDIGIVGRQDVYADDYVIQEFLGSTQTGFTWGQVEIRRLPMGQICERKVETCGKVGESFCQTKLHIKR